MEPAVELHRDAANEAAAWEVRHYHFFGLWKLWFGNFSSLLWSLLAISPIVFTSICMFLKMWNGCEEVRVWSFLVTATFLFVTMAGLGKIMRKHFRSTWGMGGMALLMPRLLAAVVTAWFTMSMSEDLFHYFSDVGQHWPLPAVITLSVITLLFVSYESKLLNPFDNLPSVILSSVVVFFVAYLYSFIVGEMVYDFFGQKMIDIMSNENDITLINTEYRHIFVLSFSFFATFIGIFLQLMLQGKSVTDTK